MRSRKEALMIVLQSFRHAPTYIALVLAMVLAVAAISYGAKCLADWASPDAGGTWAMIFMGTYVGSFLLIALVSHCWGTYRRARRG